MQTKCLSYYIKKFKNSIRIIPLLICLGLMSVSITAMPASFAEIYKYQKAGVWYYTDTPSDSLPQDRQEIEEIDPVSTKADTDAPALLAKYKTRNDVEKAAAATVFIKTLKGSGTGFFISTTGHIITNKHVVRITKKQESKLKSSDDLIEKIIKNNEKKIATNEKNLQKKKAWLDDLKRKMEAEKRPGRLKQYRDTYDKELSKYLQSKATHEKQIKSNEQSKKKYRDRRHEINYRNSVANLARTFTIILVDKTELTAHLIETSRKHDLALLKLDGYTTPALKPGSSRDMAQGEPVYAIGNPKGLKHTVTSGVFSGWEKGFLQTNAQIYPGNSGGPLVDAEGKVLGINTKKNLTRKYEGLGFAIPIEKALHEFDRYLNTD